MYSNVKSLCKRVIYYIVVVCMISTALFVSGTPVMASSSNLDIINMNKVVGICYCVWQDIFAPVKPNNNITTILQNAAINKTAPQWSNGWLYFNQPANGYYGSTDTAAITDSITKLQAAGVDFLIVDATNLESTGSSNGWNLAFNNGATALCNTLVSMRNQGKSTPYVVFWGGTWQRDPDPAYVGRKIYNDFVNNSAYSGLFVNYNGKPLFLTTELLPSELNNYFTVRKMWGLQSSLANQEWSYLSPYPQKVGVNGNQNEQISVSTANQRDYMTNFYTATPKRGGISWAQQWQRAFSVNPKIVTLTWWNEQAAIRGVDESGNTLFVDGYADPEWNRDIEPKVGGYSDTFLQYMGKYISAYKNSQPFPIGLELSSVNLGDFEVGNEGWQAGLNLSSAYDNFSQGGYAVPVAFNGYKLYEADDAAVAGQTLKTVKRNFEQPVDLSTNPIIKYSFSSWGGCPGATAYISQIRVTASNGQSVYKETPISNPSGWQDITLDTSGWPYNNIITSIEIGMYCPGSTEAWAGKFFIDDVRAESVGYNVGDFDLCTYENTEGWVANTNVSSTACVGAGGTNIPQSYHGLYMLQAQSIAVPGNAYKSVVKNWTYPINVSNYNKIELGINSWGGCPDVTSYTYTVKLWDNVGHCFQSDITRTVGWPYWQTLSVDISSWPYRNNLTKIEVGFTAGSSSAWTCQFFIDHVIFTKN